MYASILRPVRALSGALFAVALTWVASASAASAPGAQPLPLAEAQRAAAHHLVTQQREDGLFRYGYDFIRGGYMDDDNMVRQAGTGYALGEYLVHSGDSALLEPLRRLLEGYWAHSAEFQEGRLVSIDNTLYRAKAGTTALVLLTELHYYEATGDPRFAEQRQAWVTGLLNLMNDAGGFRKYHDVEEESDYYNGEVWLALAYYHSLFPEAEAVAAALPKVDAHMQERYGADPKMGFYQWGVMAATKRWEVTGDPAFAHFVASQTEAYLDEMRPRVKYYANTCAPTEGLTTAVGILATLKNRGALRDRLIHRVEMETLKNRRFQVRQGQTEWVFGADRYLVSPGLKDFAGAFVAGLYRPSTRIDFTQHCLSNLIRYQRYVVGKTAPLPGQ